MKDQLLARGIAWHTRERWTMVVSEDIMHEDFSWWSVGSRHLNAMTAPVTRDSDCGEDYGTWADWVEGTEQTA